MQLPALNFLKITLVFFVLSGMSACGPATRTADGDCYYAGKGILQIGGTLMDGLVTYGEVLSEQQYQQEQIDLQRLENKLSAVDTDKLLSDKNYANAVSDINAQNYINQQIEEYNSDVREYNRLQESISDYQDRKQRELERGPSKSVSQMVDESGECQ